MAKKNFKGGLDSLIENSLGIKKTSRKGEMKGNPVDLIKPEQTDDNDEVLAKPRTPKQSAQPNDKPAAQTTETDNAAETTTPEKAVNEDNKVSVSPATDNKAAEQPAPNKQAATASEEQSAPTNPAADNAVAETPDTDTPSETELADLDLDNTSDITETDEPETPQQNQQSQPQRIAQPTAVSLDASDNDSSTIAYLKEVIADLRHELFLWRNGTINVQTFNATLHTHGLKYNPDNNEIEEFDAI